MELLAAAAIAVLVFGVRARKNKEKSRGAAWKAMVLKKRREYTSATQSVTYNDPLMIMRGEGAYLYDQNGIKYLDTRNNVGHIGWQHPKWQAAIVRQLALTNTNTRYLHPLMVDLAERVLQKFPDHLRVNGKVYFTNSGSEANELAIRLARAHSGKQGIIVLEDAYHGWTSGAVGISPYKKYGILDTKPKVYTVPCPDTYAGEFRIADGKLTEEQAGALYAKKVEDLIQGDMNQNVSSIFIESGMGVGGVIMPPKGYMEKAFAAVRNAGGVCVCDEVQTGFGRPGSSFWMFQCDPNVCPDIVTMGKPFGNGFPLGCVVATGAVNASFEKLGMEFFSTFGGNPVACAAGHAVLDVIEEENLQAKALDVGKYIKEKARAMMKGASGNVVIGDVRGTGLFLGIEIIKRYDPDGRPIGISEPPRAAYPETYEIQRILVEKYHILTNVDGPRHNVIVIKPPMVFSRSDADYFLSSLSNAIDAVQPASKLA